jgi:hypothetical protein
MPVYGLPTDTIPRFENRLFARQALSCRMHVHSAVYVIIDYKDRASRLFHIDAARTRTNRAFAHNEVVRIARYFDLPTPLFARVPRYDAALNSTRVHLDGERTCAHEHAGTSIVLHRASS